MEKAVPGQRRIPAKDWNEIRDFLNRYAQQPGGMVNNPLNPFFVLVQNNTSSDLPAFSVVKLDGAIYPNRSTDDTKDAALNQLLEISGDTPAGEVGENIGILQEDIPAGQLGKAIVVGASLVKLHVDANKDYKFAKSVDGETDYMEAGDTGQARIIWRETGNGYKYAYVILDQIGDLPRIAKTMVNTDYSPEGATQLSTTATWLYTSTVDSYGVKNDANAPKVANPLGLPEGRPVVVAKCGGFSPDDKDDPYITQDDPPDVDLVAIAADTRDLFTAYSHHSSGTNMSGNPGDYKKGNLFYLTWDSTNNRWIPGSDTDGRLAVCQRDCPNMFGKPFLMPYYSLEMNYGLPPNKSTNSNEQFTSRCGVASGEHVLSNKRLDYHYCNGRYAYEPVFTFKGAVTGSYMYDVKIEIEGTQYDVHFPEDGQGSNMPRFTPDIYIGDLLTVSVDASSSQPVITAINYPVDFQEGSFLLTNMYGAACAGNTWRGWEDVTDTYYGNLPANAVVVYIRNGAAQLGTAAVGQQGVDIDLPEIWDMRNTLGLNLYYKVKNFADGCIH